MLILLQDLIILLGAKMSVIGIGNGILQLILAIGKLHLGMNNNYNIHPYKYI
jgi:hypothetical protein